MTSHPLTDSNPIAGRRARRRVDLAATWVGWRATQRQRAHQREQARHDQLDCTDQYLDGTRNADLMSVMLAAARLR